MTDADKLRPAVEVWKAATNGYDSSLFGKVGVGKLDRDKADQAAAAIIEADRAQCLAALQAHADALAGEMRRSRDGWWNVAELGLVPPQHMHTAIVLADSAAEALRAYEAFKAGEPT